MNDSGTPANQKRLLLYGPELFGRQRQTEQPWFPTGLPIKNNKKRAEKMLLELRQTYVPPAEHKSNGELSADMLFADFMELWLEVVRNSIEKTTFSSYTQMVKGKIAPYFRKTGVKLGELQARHIQSFYLYELKTVSASTVIHERANIHKALKYAVKMDLIPYNPADKVERPKKQKYIADYYRLEELEQLFEATKVSADPDHRVLRAPAQRGSGPEMGRHRL